MINEPNRSCCIRLWSDNRELFEKAQGSIVKHQAWRGGYLQHLEEVMNIAIAIYTPLNSLRALPFSLPSALLVLYLHDLEKPFKQEHPERFLDVEGKKKREVIEAFKSEIIGKYGLVLSDDEKNGLQYVEGEIDDYSLSERKMNELATFCHCCDILSARAWYDRPLGERDSWRGGI